MRDGAGDLVSGAAELDVAGAVVEHDRAAKRVVVVHEADVDVEVGHGRAVAQGVDAVGGELRLTVEQRQPADVDVDVDAAADPAQRACGLGSPPPAR